MSTETASATAPVQPIVMPSCDGCGVCCMHMSVPPFEPSEVKSLPEDVRVSLGAVRQSRTLQLKVHGTDFIPCGWFDMETRQCRHYEYRPQVCRDFDAGSTYCQNLRIDAGLEA